MKYNYTFSLTELSYLLRALSDSILWSGGLDEIVYIYEIQTKDLESVYIKIIKNLGIKKLSDRISIEFTYNELLVIDAVSNISSTYNQSHLSDKSIFLDKLGISILQDIQKKKERSKKNTHYKNHIKEGITDISSININGAEILNINYNNITHLEAYDVKNLKRLNLNNNKIEKIENLDVKKLKYLDVSNNKLTNIQHLNVKNLSALDMSENQLSEIHGFNVKELKSLILRGNQLTNILGFDVKRLQELNLNENQLTNIQDVNVKNLLELSLSGNYIVNVDGIDLKSLRFIDLSFNKIKKIKNFDCKNLEILYLFSNNIQKLELSHLENMTTLDIRNNPIIYINPETIMKMRKIPDLIMDNHLDDYDKNGYLKQGIFSRMKQIFNK
ncbi:hypothetical protein COB57_04975 [Candidatus Peregrinibacteria bacterium]|nr:MAG: hypothetical protein COB57_04975 [Candidatus Peregrinibacteria bacterium]